MVGLIRMKNETTLTSEAKNARALGPEVLAQSQDINAIETMAGNVPNIFQTHYVDTKTGEKGIADLICRILRERGAIFPAGAEQSELRQIAIAGAMFADQIVAEVQSRFTVNSIRYPEKTVKAYLSVHLSKPTGPLDNQTPARVGRIHLTKNEDQPRPCDKPRCKWFLIA
jgi:hypothetical protein